MVTHRGLRYLMSVVAGIQIILAVIFFLRLPIAGDIWPLGYTTTSTSFIFVASILAAAAASTIWWLFSNEPGALAGIALDYVTILAPVSIFAFQSSTRVMFNLGLVCAVTAFFGVLLLVWSARIPIQDKRPMPRPVRISFVIFVIALFIVGGQLIFKTPNILPWRVNAPSSVIYGWFFIGAATYFIYALLRPSWHNSGGQLAGFLAYDLVLIVPFIQQLPTVQSNWRLSLIIYIAVLLYSGALAFYYLFIHAETRMIRPVFATRESAL